MRKAKRSNRGFTLLETLITMAILSSIVSLSTSLFIGKIKVCRSLDRKVELQQQGLFILAFIENKIIEAEGIHYLEDTAKKDMMHTSSPVKINKIVFKNPTGHAYAGYVFNLSKMTEYGFKLLYKTGLSGTGTVEIGDYIKTIEVESIPADAIYAEANGIVIRINFLLDDDEAVVENAYCFRNKPGRL